jgi:hypothetical protein
MPDLTARQRDGAISRGGRDLPRFATPPESEQRALGSSPPSAFLAEASPRHM